MRDHIEIELVQLFVELYEICLNYGAFRGVDDGLATLFEEASVGLLVDQHVEDLRVEAVFKVLDGMLHFAQFNIQHALLHRGSADAVAVDNNPVRQTLVVGLVIF